MSGPAAQGYLHVYTGHGKGKTTAAFGLAMRALGRGKRVIVIQFLKGAVPTGEVMLAQRLGDGIRVHRYADRPTATIHGAPDEHDRRSVAAAWARARQVLRSGECDLLVLDEINNALHYHLVDLDELLDALRARPPHLEVVCTGRWAPPLLIDQADLVTEMRPLKHYADRGVPARLGIEL
jgi:cob(I)alamin adenosyltransferase